jgi:hypothetical protein
MSSTGTVAVMLPVVVSLAWRARISPSKLLIPLTMASLHRRHDDADRHAAEPGRLEPARRAGHCPASASSPSRRSVWRCS